jgi:predicted amidohydrolase
MSQEMITVAACAVPDIQGDVDATVTLLLDHSEEAASADASLVVFPEGFLQGFTRDAVVARSRAFDLASPEFSDEVLERLAHCRPLLVFGLIELDHGSIFNTAVVVDQGTLVGKYRKQHIHPSEHIYTAGDTTPVFEHKGLRFGINICYDARFPEAAAALADQDVDLLVYPLNNMHPRETAERWRHRHLEFLTARAKQTGAWVVSADVTGSRDKQLGYGPTAIIAPSGELVARVPELATGMVTHLLPIRQR